LIAAPDVFAAEKETGARAVINEKVGIVFCVVLRLALNGNVWVSGFEFVQPCLFERISPLKVEAE